MLDVETKSRINTARDILVGKVPDPKSQVEQITIALIYKFMDDMDVESEELGGKRTFFVGEYAKYAWRKIFDPRQSGFDLLNLYSEAIGKMDTNPGVPKLFRDIFKNAYLPYRDPETLKSFLKIINEFDYSHSEKLGDAFEYLLSVLGSQGDAGQFRTPRHIIDFMVEIVDPKKDETILDPACGTAGFLISSYKHIIRQNSSNYNPDEHNGVSTNGDQSVADRIISTNGYAGDKLTADDRKLLAKNIHGYDISPDMVRLSLVNMYLHGIKDPKIFEYDTLTSEDNWHHFSDVILANPPFMTPKGGIRPHKRFSVQSNRSEVLFVDYIAEHLTTNGRAAVIVPEGIIFQSGKAYKQLRKKLVEECLVGVISLPAGVFQPYSGVKTSILWLDKVLAKKTDKILFVKIEHDGFDLGAQRRAVKGNDLPCALQNISRYKSQLITGNLTGFEQSKMFSLVLRKDISDYGNYSLSQERYVKGTISTSVYDLTEIKNICQVKGGKRLPKGTDFADSKTDHPYIRVTDFKPNTLNSNNIKYIREETFSEISNYTISSEDVYISIAGTIGIFGIIPEQYNGANLTENAAKFIIDKTKLNKYFLSYIGNSDRVKEQIEKLTHSVGVPKLALERIKIIKIPLPPLSIQEEIVAEIESYQKIIDGARQVVENYKPRIEIDPGWEMVELGEVFSKINQSVLPHDLKVHEINYIGLENISQGSGEIEGNILVNPKSIKSTKTVFQIGDILYGKLRPNLNKVYYAEVEGICSTDIFVLRGKADVLSKFYHYHLLSQGFNNMVLKNIRGAQLPRVGYADFAKILVPVPPKEKQLQIVEQIDRELCTIKLNKSLIGSYELRIKDRIAKVWGSNM